MSELVVRAYNIGFGDAVLVSIPEQDAAQEVTRHLLIDVGNLLAGSGNEDAVFAPVVRDISERTQGEVDLYVMTHEHLDHVQGLLAASRAGVPLAATYAWLTGSAAPDYYDINPDAKRRLNDLQLTLEDAQRLLQAGEDPWLEMMIRNNSTMLPAGALGLKTGDYVDHIRGLAKPEHTHYVDRTFTTDGNHPFREATLRILAPEADTTSYYGRSTGGTVTATPAADARKRAAATKPTPNRQQKPPPADALPAPPAGVEPGAYFDLLASRHRATRTRLMEIDAANNNTSVVLEIEWRGWRLLFPGDAELRSWKTMREQQLLRPVHFIKVSHHGSHNGTDDEHFDEILPPTSHDGRPRHALVSTAEKNWDTVPDRDTLMAYAARCELHDTRTVERGTPVEIRFPG